MTRISPPRPCDWVPSQAKSVWQCNRAASKEENRVGKSGRYFSVLNCASLKGLSSETCGTAVGGGSFAEQHFYAGPVAGQ